MKVLVTGAAGFIGYHVVTRLFEKGAEVIAIDNLMDNLDLDLKRGRLTQLGLDMDLIQQQGYQTLPHGLRFYQLDILDRESMYNLCTEEQFDTIIHLAAVTGSFFVKHEPAKFMDVNVTGTINMLEAAKAGGVKHFFFSSSAAVYGDHAQSPLREDDDVDRPLNLYAASKRASEIVCYTYARAFGIATTIFRFFTVYGNWCRRDTIPMQLAHDIMQGNEICLFNNGNLVRDLTYVDDVIDAMDEALLLPPYQQMGEAPYQLFNIGRSEPIPFVAYIHAMEKALGKKANITFSPQSPLTIGEREIIYADTERLQRILSYSPIWDYETALPGFVEWFKQNYNVTFTL